MQVKASNLFSKAQLVIVITVYLVWFCFPLLSAQGNFNNDETKDSVLEKKFIFIEAGGTGILLSFNYERLIFDKIGLRTGVNPIIFYGITIPAMINFYIGSSRQLELGIGVVYSDLGKTAGLFYTGEILVSATIGHKYQKENSDMILRFSFTPFYSYKEDKVFLFGGISLGWAF